MGKHLRLGEILKQAGIIDDFQLNSALSYQRQRGGRFGESLIKLGYLTEEKLQGFLARQFDLPQIGLSGRKISEDILAYIPVEKALEFHVLPVERREINGHMYLVVAMTDPTNLMVIDSLQFLTGCRIKAALAFGEEITSAIGRNYRLEPDSHENPDSVSQALAEPVQPFDSPVARADTPLSSSSLEGGFAPSALEKLEKRYKNLIHLLLDRGVIDSEDLDRLK